MNFNLLDILKNQFDDQLIGNISSFLGEKDSDISKALSGILPAVTGALSNKATSGQSGANEVLNLAKNTYQSGLFSNLSGLIGNAGLLERGSELIKNLLGDKAGSIISAIASFAGIKTSSASSLMNMAASAALHSLGKFATENGINAEGLSNIFSFNYTSILGAIPAGLGSLVSTLGLKSASEKMSEIREKMEKISQNGKRMAWLMPLLLLLLLSLLAWYLLSKQGCNAVVNKGNKGASGTIADTDGQLPSVKGTLDSATGDFVYDVGNMITIELPNNAGKLEVGENSTEAKLVEFLKDNSKGIDTVKGNWFDFTNVRFKTGKTEVTDESMKQLENIVKIAKAFPNAKFKIGGYTDNTGDSLTNMKISQLRAETVAKLLVKMGMNTSAITGAEGYGPQWPIGDKNTPEGRAMNRRVSLKVVSK
ncbi:MAG: OmpA family protein [Chitinophagaceae bacterium]|nr:OmpA family protein [Chitinophagaceae bacterium]